MHTHVATRLAAAVCATLLCAAGAAAQDTKAATPSPAMEAMMKTWAEISTPGAPHRLLAGMVGYWNVTTRAWMNGPGTAPETSKGTSTYTAILDGRFIRQEVHGTMSGMPFTGIGITGYDNFKKKYVGFWIDNSSTALFTMEGSADSTGNVITSFGTMDDWMTGERNKTVKYVTRIINADTAVFEIHDPSLHGPDTMTMDMTLTRAR
jgi:hypothetical protein